MKRSAFPFVCGRYGRVRLCLIRNVWHTSENAFDKKADPLSVRSARIAIPCLR